MGHFAKMKKKERVQMIPVRIEEDKTETDIVIQRDFKREDFAKIVLMIIGTIICIFLGYRLFKAGHETEESVSQYNESFYETYPTTTTTTTTTKPVVNDRNCTFDCPDGRCVWSYDFLGSPECKCKDDSSVYNATEKACTTKSKEECTFTCTDGRCIMQYNMMGLKTCPCNDVGAEYN